MRNDTNAATACEDWWDITESTDIYNLMCYRLIKDIQFRQQMVHTQKFETISVGICQFYHLLASEMTTIDTKTSVNTYLKNLMHYIHQNFLVAAKFLYSRIADRRASNVWMEKLKNLVDEKLVKQIKSKNQAVQMLRVNLQNSENIIRNIISANLRKQFFTVLNEYVSRLALFPNDKIRDVLYNIEQFKFDAMIQPELNLKSSVSRSSNSSSSSTNSSSKSLGSSTATKLG